MMNRFLFSLFVSAAALLVTAGCAGNNALEKKPDAASDVSGPRTIIFPTANNKTLSVSGFRTIDNKWCTEQTEIFLQRSKDGIRIVFHCYGDTSKMQFSPKEKDDNMNLFGGEHVEFQLSPNGHADGIYYHFAINPAGSMYHAKKRDTSWTPAYDLKIEKQKDRWICNVFVPYYTLGVKAPPKNGKTWLVNFCRTIAQKNKAAEHCSLTGAKNFHHFGTMAKLVFDGKTPAATLRLLKFQQTDSGDLKLRVSKNGAIHTRLNVISNGKRIDFAELKDNTVKDLRFAIKDNYVPLKNNRTLTLQLTDAQGNVLEQLEGNLLTSDSHFLLLNRYVYFKNEPVGFTVNTIPGTFRIKQDDKLISQTSVNALKNTFRQSLAPGRYVAEYESKGRYTSCVFMVQEKRPAALPPMPGKFRISGSDLTLNGKPFYLFATSEGKLQNYQYYPDFSFRYGPGARKNAIRRGGLPYHRLIRKPKTGYAFVKDFDAKLERFIKSQKKHQRSNIVYLLAYEANLAAFLRQADNSLLEVDPPALYKKTYTRMKQEMPDAKIVIHIDNLNRMDEFIQCCDIFEFACWTSSYHSTNMMQDLKKDILAVRSRSLGKPLVMWLGGSIPNAHCRSAEELRAGVYCSILNGLTGNVIHMGHGGIPAHRTRFWSTLNAITREVDSFYADLKTWREIKDFAAPVNMDGKAVVSPDGKELLLVLLNNTMEEVKISLDLPESFGKLNATFTPLEPRVFRVRKGK